MTTMPWPASSVQESMWLAERMEPDSALYNVPMAWRVEGRLDPDVLRHALAMVVVDHEILRTAFTADDGQLLLHTAGPWVPDLDRVDLREMPAADRETRADQWLRERAEHGFDLASGRPLRAGLIDLDARTQILFVCVHHLAWDAASTALFLADLRRCYDEVAERSPQRPAEEPEPRTHHNPTLVLRLARQPDPDRLRAAVSAILARHEMLRTDARAEAEPRWLETTEWAADSPPELRAAIEEPFRAVDGTRLRVTVQPVTNGATWLALTADETVADRVSMTVLARQLAAELGGRSEATPAGRSDRDRESDDGRADRDTAVLAERLDGPPRPIELPGRHAGAGRYAGQHEVALTLPDAAVLAAFAARQGVAVEAVLLAALRVQLAWYSGQWDFTVGAVRDRRDETRQHTVGPLANIVPMRLRARPEQDFRSLVVDSAAELSLAARHSHARLRELAPLVAGRAPVNVLLDFGEEPAELALDGSAPVEVAEFHTGQGRFDLRLSVSWRGETLQGRVRLDGRHFDPKQATGFADHYARLLTEAIREPETPVGRFEPLSEDERRTQLHEWNDTAATFPDVTLHELVRARADAQPEAVALTCGTQRRTYRELVERAETLARGLVAGGVRPGEFVALVIDRGLAQIEAMLAVLFAGAAYVPIDTALPPDRMAYLLNDCASRWVITGDDPPEGLTGAEGGNRPTVTLDRLAELGGADVALPVVTSTATAYCIYTSGTTGRPKGVVVSHRNVVRLIDNDRFPFDFGAHDVWTMFHSYSFDVSVWEVFCCLTRGGRLVTVPRDVARDAERLWELVTRERVTVVCQTPSAFAQLVQVADGSVPGHLRYLILAGEKLSPRLVGPWLGRRPAPHVVNMYGPTEATIYATARFLTPEDVEGDVSDIGRPVPASTLYLLDPECPTRLIPAGAVGEIHLGGDGIATGYLDRPDLDAARFVPNPFGPGRLYRTGDFARYLPDGSVEYLGRRDTQVKLRGHRIELEEIASCLCEHPAVGDAVVLLDEAGDGHLAAYVRPRRPAPSTAELRTHLRRLLPDYMVPARFYAMHQRQLTENGKLDRVALRAHAEPLDAARIAPVEVTPTAAELGAIWSELLGIEEPAADDSFFEKGGHSLLVFKLIALVARKLGTELRARDVFQRPRLQDLADYVDELRGTVPESPAEARAPEQDAAESGPRSRYQDFVLAQLSRRTSVEGAAGLEHLASRLAGAPSFLPLAPPRRAEPHGAVRVPLPDDVLARLADLRADEGTSWYMVTAAALSAMLHRWTGEEDVAFGTPVSIRGERHADVIGPCLNTVVLRSTPAEPATLGDVLRSMRDTVLDAFEHADVPFEALVDRLNPPRRPGWTPYLDVALVADVLPAESPTIAGHRLTPIPFGGGDFLAKFGMTAAFVEDGGRLSATLFYRGDRFARAEVERMARWLGLLVERFPDVLDVPLGTLDLVDGDDLAELARFESGGPAEPPATVPDLVWRQCAERPDAIAVFSAGGALSYRELGAKARAVASVLRPTLHGDAPVVAISLPRGQDLVVAMLAAWTAGCAFCPLEPDYPRSRVDFILDDLDACAVLTDDPELTAHLSDRRTPVIGVRNAQPDPSTHDGRLAVSTGRDDTAYVLYTSGTTGRPKGVAYSHGSLADVTTWHLRQFDYGSSDRVSQLHSVAFDVTQWELWPALCAGATVLPYERQVLAPELAEWVPEHGVTILFTPTPLAEALWSAQAELPGLRWLFFAGSALTQHPPETTGYRICDGYGPTETYITTSLVVEPGSAGPLNGIGRPIAGNRVFVLDEAGRRCPVGVPGEIHVAGASVSQGYWRRPELTAERFSGVDPDGGTAWMYRTGDRGRWLPDGTLEFLGRRDRQLKIRGYRVEPQDIETHLRADPLVRQAVVHAFGTSGPLVGYVVADGDQRPDGDAVLARLRARLPNFMLPDAIQWLDEIPTTSRGKVDTARLPRPGRDELARGAPAVEPSSDLERRIAGVWSDVLGVDTVGVQDNFFDLGGNSLLLAKLHTRLQTALGTTLPIRLLFEFPTVATLATGLTTTPDEIRHVTGEDPRERARRARQARVARTPHRLATP